MAASAAEEVGAPEDDDSRRDPSVFRRAIKAGTVCTAFFRISSFSFDSASSFALHVLSVASCLSAMASITSVFEGVVGGVARSGAVEELDKVDMTNLRCAATMLMTSSCIS